MFDFRHLRLAGAGIVAFAALVGATSVWAQFAPPPPAGIGVRRPSPAMPAIQPRAPATLPAPALALPTQTAEAAAVVELTIDECRNLSRVFFVLDMQRRQKQMQSMRSCIDRFTSQP